MKTLTLLLLSLITITGYSQTSSDSTTNYENTLNKEKDSLSKKYNVNVDLVIRAYDGDEVKTYIKYRNDCGGTFGMWVNTEKYIIRKKLHNYLAN